MTVMDDNDLERGPTMIRQSINLRNIDNKFMATFIKGIDQHGLHNTVIQNALDIGVHKDDIVLDSLKPAQIEVYDNHVKWTEGATKSQSILYNGNHRFTYMRDHSTCHNIFLHYKKTQEEMKKTTNGLKHDAMRSLVAEDHGLINKHGVWLVKFFDQGA